MKYIEFPELERLSRALTHEGPECSVHTRIEAYSCKNVSRDKKLFRSLEHSYAEEYGYGVSPHSPFSAGMGFNDPSESAPFGPMDKPASRKTLYLLIATLNIAFPDHEFAGVRSVHFAREESGARVLNALSKTLVSTSASASAVLRKGAHTFSAYPPTSANDFFPSSEPTSSSPTDPMRISPLAPPPLVTGTHPTLYRMLDDVIGLPDCEVYSYMPDIASDPHADSSGGDDEGSPADDDESLSESDEEAFVFDDYDIDEAHKPRSYSPTGLDIPSNRRAPKRNEEGSPLCVRTRRRGALLWSSHWFFLNRKLKRILFISVFARTKGGHQWTEYEEVDEVSFSPGQERFLGWEGAVGAGARAMGLQVKQVA